MKESEVTYVVTDTRATYCLPYEIGKEEHLVYDHQ